MRHASAAARVLIVLLTSLGIACRRQPVRAAPLAALLPEDHCWWTVVLTTLPPDTVALRFQRAFVAIGLTDAGWMRRADTAWAHAGPTPLEGKPAGARYASRVVAYQQGDSTRFRYFIAVGAPGRGWAQQADSVEAWMRQLPLCGEIARAAAIPWSRPRRGPNGEDSLAVWTRRP